MYYVTEGVKKLVLKATLRYSHYIIQSTFMICVAGISILFFFLMCF